MTQSIIHISVTAQDKPSVIYTFNTNHIVIGSNPKVADLVLHSSHVSRRHAVVHIDATHMKIEDAGSKNGLFINGTKSSSASITDKDIINIGEFELKITYTLQDSIDIPVANKPADSTSIHNKQPISQTNLVYNDSHHMNYHDDDDDAPYTPRYSVTEMMLKDDRDVVSTNTQQDACIEMLTYDSTRQRGFINLTICHCGEKISTKHIKTIRQFKYTAQGDCLLECPKDTSIKINRQDKIYTQDIFNIQSNHALAGKLEYGDIVTIAHGNVTTKLRYIITPTPRADTRGLWQRISLDGQLFKISGISLLAHCLVGLAITLLLRDTLHKHVRDEFVVTTKDELTLPQLPPKVVIEKPTPTPPDKTTPKHKLPKRIAHVPIKHIEPHVEPTKQPVTKPTAPPAPAGILGLLQKTGKAQAPGPEAAIQAVSNLSAVKTPNNVGSFHVSGLIGKIPSSNNISLGGGGGGIHTKGGSNLLRGGTGKLRDTGNREVRGLVEKVGGLMHTAGQGALDKALIEKVVNEKTSEIQRCYENELLHDNSLAGKVQLEWVIDTDGSVASVRQTVSTINSVAVVRCMMNAIRSWHFPKPQGGQVVVSYPFIFKGIDF